MVDNRSAGFYGIGGAFNFKSGDPSGTAAKMSQDKYGSEAMYLPPAENEEGQDNFYNQPFVDRSALLRATLNSLAMTNVASVLNAQRHKQSLKNLLDKEEDEEEIKNLDDVFKDEEESESDKKETDKREEEA